ncbi:MCE family protein [Sulfuricurvum sp. IAE1]|uniref:MlaD family protein n=1 Tax=Sulfuricurvum sp. IAE1 TaxID=2546102 RepID=UPI00104353D1|nr:MlaD family protein [Sulfuricurvum sp. IAE1]TDA69266.1 MCE family protein [Sulfuricurvum sp. IAE1]
MESRYNYTFTGLFVVVFAMGLIAFAFWLGKYGQDEHDYRRFHVYITESVSGLAPEAAVKYNGVDVGKVESIRINPRNNEEVELILKIKKETPIKTDSYAVLKFYGITGLAFIEITGGSNNAPLLMENGQRASVIPSRPSLITRLDESLSNVANKLSQTLDRADRLFDDRNIENVRQSLEHLRSLSAQIDGYQKEIKTILERSAALESNASEALGSMKNAAGSVKQTSDNLNTLVQTKMTATLDSLHKTSIRSDALIHKLETSLDRGDYDLKSIASPTAAELSELISQTKTLTQEMETTIRELRESPSDLLFKKTPHKPGPGE